MTDAPTMTFWSATDSAGLVSFNATDDQRQVPQGATLFATEAAFNAAVQAARFPAPTLAAAQVAQAALLNAACAAAITGGYASSALGTPHWYGSQVTAQLNLGADMVATAVNPSTTAMIACSADNGVTWSDVEHSAAQIATLYGDCRAWRIACQAKNRGFQAQVAAATTVAAVQAITWA